MRTRITIAVATVAVLWCQACSDDAGVDAGPAAPDGPLGEALAREAVTEMCDAPESSGGFVDGDEFEARALAYLRLSTEEVRPSPDNLVAHLMRARLEADYEPPTDSVALDAWDEMFDEIDSLTDTSDFDVLAFLNLLYEADGHAIVAPALYQRIEETLFGFKYWFKDATPEGKSDDMWYWTENHLCGFHAAEYLAGQRFPDATFTTAGLTGREHQARARELLLEWFDTIRRFGFKEFHSDVYYDVQLRPLLMLAEYAEDEDIRTLAAITADLMLFDLAMHTRGGTFGASRGRTYKKDKLSTLDQNTFAVAKFVFDQTDLDYSGNSRANVLLLAGATRYRVPQVIVDVARDDRPFVDRERMSVPIDEVGPRVDNPEAPDSLSFTDPADLNAWWGMSALSNWQLIGLTLQTMDEFNLWDNASFASFRPLMALSASPELAVGLAYDNRAVLNFGTLSEVNSYTYRTADYMLSSAQDRRFGFRSNQGHPWQATLGDEAYVFVTHPGQPPIETDSWRDDGDTGQWTGSASLPRSGQYGNVAIHLQSPKYGPDELPLFPPLSTYEPYTHAFFPQENFDEVVHHVLDDSGGSWTFARLGDGYLALYSLRPAAFFEQPDGVPTRDFEQAYDLRAEGGPDNVWIVEMGSAQQWQSLEAFREAILAAEVTVTQRDEAQEAIPPSTGELPPFFEQVRYVSPSRGEITFGHDAPLVVDGETIELSGYARHDNPWSHSEFGASRYQITTGCDATGVQLDFEQPARSAW